MNSQLRELRVKNANIVLLIILHEIFHVSIGYITACTLTRRNYPIMVPTLKIVLWDFKLEIKKVLFVEAECAVTFIKTLIDCVMISLIL